MHSTSKANCSEESEDGRRVYRKGGRMLIRGKTILHDASFVTQYVNMKVRE